MWHKQV